MRFRFCWDCDCPDWILAEISNISKLRHQEIKEVTLHIAYDACGRGKLNLDYLISLISPECKFELKTVRAIVAAIRWILSNAAGADVEATVLRSELQQLGLTKEHSIFISEIYDAEKERLQDSLKNRTLQASENVSSSFEIKEAQFEDGTQAYCQINLQGKLLEQEYGYFSEPYPVKKEMETKEEREETKVVLTGDQLDGLINELGDVMEDMEELEGSSKR